MNVPPKPLSSSATATNGAEVSESLITDVARQFSLHGQTALVTGASRGLGLTFAKVLASAGASVAIAGRSLEKVTDVAQELSDSGVRAVGVRMDVREESTIAPALAQARDALGPLSILINNAGIAITKPALASDSDEWDQVIDTNLRGPWLVAQAFAKAWLENRNQATQEIDANADQIQPVGVRRSESTTLGNGVEASTTGSGPSQTGASIVNIASILGQRIMPGVASYTVSKAALLQLTRQLAAEWARYDIRVNALAPGYFETEMNADYLKSTGGEALRKRVPMRRFGNVDDLAAPLLLLCSPGGAYITGATIDIDGGLSVMV